MASMGGEGIPVIVTEVEQDILPENKEIPDNQEEDISAEPEEEIPDKHEEEISAELEEKIPNKQEEDISAKPEEEILDKPKPITFKKLVQKFITGKRMTSSMVGKMQGKILVKCALPQDLTEEVSILLDWQIEKESEPSLSASATAAKNKQTTRSPGDTKQIKNQQKNAFISFLDKIEDIDADDEQEDTILTGLRSWLGFAGSVTNTMTKSTTMLETAQQPWQNQAKADGGDDNLTRKAEESMTQIAAEFCNWLRQLPGDDRTVNSVTEDHLRSLFDSAQNANPSGSKLAEGLMSWAKFGAAVTGVEKERRKSRWDGSEDSDTGFHLADTVKLASRGSEKKKKGRKTKKKTKKTMENGRENETLRDRQHYYGAWYLEPKTWRKRYQRQVETRGGTQILDLTQARLGAQLPGQVDMMGNQQPVSELQATKAFGTFLSQKPNYKKSPFIKHILKPTANKDAKS